MMSRLFQRGANVRIGHGKRVHATHAMPETYKSKYSGEVLFPMCGAGDRGHVSDRHETDDPVTCRRCVRYV